jgi:hypothetical protein
MPVEMTTRSVGFASCTQRFYYFIAQFQGKNCVCFFPVATNTWSLIVTPSDTRNFDLAN